MHLRNVATSWKELFSSSHPSCIYNYLSIESLLCCVCTKRMSYLYQNCEWQTVLCYLFYAHLIRVWHDVLTLHLIIGYMCNVQTWYGYVDRENYWCLSRVVLSYCFSKFWCMLSCSSESNYKSKVKGKVSGFPHMVCLSFISKCMRNLMPEIEVVCV